MNIFKKNIDKSINYDIILVTKRIQEGKMKTKFLKSKMVLYGDTNLTLSQKLKISPATLSSKVNAKNKFTTEEMNSIRLLYNLTDREFIEIFIE